MCRCVCMYIRTYIHSYNHPSGVPSVRACVHACVRICMYIYIYIYTYTHTHTHTHTYTYTYTYTYIYIYICICGASGIDKTPPLALARGFGAEQSEQLCSCFEPCLVSPCDPSKQAVEPKRPNRESYTPKLQFPNWASGAEDMPTRRRLDDAPAKTSTAGEADLHGPE